MSEKLDKLRASLEKERERRIKINTRIESLERRIQEAEAAEVNEMVRTAKDTPNSFAIRDRSINSCEKRDSADAVVVRNAIDLSSCNLSGLSAGAILNCGSAPYFQHVHLPENAENSQLRRLPAPDYVTGSFHRPVGIFAPTAFA